MSNSNKRKNQQPDSNSEINTIVSAINQLKHFADLSVDDLVDYADKLGRFLSQNNLKTNQIRKFFDAVKKIESESNCKKQLNTFSVKLLKPKLAYAAGRQKEVKPLMAVLDPCINKVNTLEDFNKFARFVESIVAYHKYHGGRDK